MLVQTYSGYPSCVTLEQVNWVTGACLS